MSTAEARVCLGNDLSAHVETIEGWRAQVASHRGGLHFLDNEAAFASNPLPWLVKRATCADVILVTGLYANFPLGVASARINQSASGARTAIVDLILVDAEARGVGVGEAMMALLVQWATKRGCTSLEANALPGDRNTKNFFEGTLMKARLLTLSTQIPLGT